MSEPSADRNRPAASRNRISTEESDLVPCRFVIHEFTDATGHIDLFLDMDGQSELLSFRIDLTHKGDIEEAAASGPMRAISVADEQVLKQLTARAILCEKTPRHRRLYWDYEGPVSGDRGNVRELVRGWIQKPAGEGLFVILLPKKRFWSNVKGRIMAWFYGRS